MTSIIMAILFLAGEGRLLGQSPQNEGPIPDGGSLVISEILYDPEPAVGLPSFEYVEWFNRGGDTVDLGGWQWVVGDKVRKVSGGRVPPGSYVIVCSPAAAPAFRALGSVITIESFPALVNSGGWLTLINPAGQTVHSVEYSPDQFADALKVNGGWSLELADVAQYCNSAAWLPSVDPSGGTPGRANSQQVTIPNPEPPKLLRAAGYDDQTFVILFSGTLNPQSDMNNYTCQLMPGMFSAYEVPARENGFPGLFFSIPEGLDCGLTYTLELNGDIVDCSGQAAHLREVSFGFPSAPGTSDLVISEIMFDPRTDQVEFVEVFNRSERVIELHDLILARADASGAIRSFSDQQLFSYWLFPGNYAVFTSDDKQFLRAWPETDPACVAKRPDMPSLTNEESILLLMDKDQKKLDAAAYSPDWHYPYLEDSKGVSLERIDFDLPGTEKSNWFSSSTDYGGATPGLINSTGKNPPENTAEHFTLNSAIGYVEVSPDPVQVKVRYNFDNQGWFLRIDVYSNEGLPVSRLFPFGMASMEGIVCWDGLDSAGRLVPDGIYLIVADYYHPSGKKGRWKKACAIVRAY